MLSKTLNLNGWGFLFSEYSSLAFRKLKTLLVLLFHYVCKISGLLGFIRRQAGGTFVS